MQGRQKDTPDFFIDYHDADVQWARWIAWQLKNAHYTVFYREQNIWPGLNKVLTIDDVLQKDTRVILLLSPDYLQKDLNNSALSGGPIWSAKLSEGNLVPIRVRNCQVKGFLSPIATVDIVGLDEVEALAQLLASLSTTPKPFVEKPDFPGSSDAQRQAQRPYRYPGSLPPIWNVPARNRIFTDRDPVLAKLYETFREGQEGQVISHVIKGLGGIGKTQVAIEYAYRYSHRYDAVLWIDVTDEQSFTKHLVDIEQLLILQMEISKGIFDPPEFLPPKLVVKQWLQALSGNMRWLLILDNIADFALINDFIPSGGNGHILMTVRAQATGIIASSPDSLLELSPEDGTLLLLRRMGKVGSRTQIQDVSQADLLVAQELSDLMGSLPLALDQAGAYMESADIDLPRYLEYYKDKRLRRILLEQRGEPSMYHPDPVATTWNDTFAVLRDFNPSAYSLLLLCSFLHHEAIPEEVLTQGVASLPAFQAIADNPLQRDKAYAELRRYSLLMKDNQSDTFSMHRMIQVVLHDALSEQERHLWAERAIFAVYTVLQTVEQNAQIFHYSPRYFFHTRRCLRAMEAWSIASEEAVSLLFLMGKNLYHYAQNPSLKTATTILNTDTILKELEDYAVLLRNLKHVHEAEQLVDFCSHIRNISLPDYQDATG